MNPNKSKVIRFRPKNKLEVVKYGLNICIDNTRIDIYDSAKNLGIIRDTPLRLSQHVNMCIKILQFQNNLRQQKYFEL